MSRFADEDRQADGPDWIAAGVVACSAPGLSRIAEAGVVEATYEIQANPDFGDTTTIFAAELPAAGQSSLGSTAAWVRRMVLDQLSPMLETQRWMFGILIIETNADRAEAVASSLDHLADLPIKVHRMALDHDAVEGTSSIARGLVELAADVAEAIAITPEAAYDNEPRQDSGLVLVDDRAAHQGVAARPKHATVSAATPWMAAPSRSELAPSRSELALSPVGLPRHQRVDVAAQKPDGRVRRLTARIVGTIRRRQLTTPEAIDRAAESADLIDLVYLVHIYEAAEAHRLQARRTTISLGLASRLSEVRRSAARHSWFASMLVAGTHVDRQGPPRLAQDVRKPHLPKPHIGEFDLPDSCRAVLGFVRRDIASFERRGAVVGGSYVVMLSREFPVVNPETSGEFRELCEHTSVAWIVLDETGEPPGLFSLDHEDVVDEVVTRLLAQPSDDR